MFGRKFNKRETLYLSAMVEDQMRKIEILIGSIPDEEVEKYPEPVEKIMEMYIFLQNLQKKI